MPRLCTVCHSGENREAIDSALCLGQPFRSIARQFGVSAPALARHKAGHLSPAVAVVAAERAVSSARSALQRIESLAAKVEAAMDRAEKGGQSSVFLAAARELRSSVELLAKLSGELTNPGVQVSVVNLEANVE